MLALCQRLVAFVRLTRVGKHSTTLAYLLALRCLGARLPRLRVTDNVNSKRQPKVFLDITNLSVVDSATGIHRVVKEFLHRIIMQDNSFSVTLVTSRGIRGGYLEVFASGPKYDSFTASVQAVSPAAGDIFLGLDLNIYGTIRNKRYLRSLKESGVRVAFVVYDVLPLEFPNFWRREDCVTFGHKLWLNAILESNMLISISNDVSAKVELLAESLGFEDKPRFETCTLGSDFNRLTSAKAPTQSASNVPRGRKSKSYLMVGTIEPRKGVAEVLDVFEALWITGELSRLTIVGRIGWLTDRLVERLASLQNAYPQLKWLRDVGDAQLEDAYFEADFLIAASFGEGFGLPLVEASQRGMAVIARDIPVFREVAGERALYFNSKESLHECIRLAGNTDDHAPWVPEGCARSWDEAAEELKSLLFYTND